VLTDIENGLYIKLEMKNMEHILGLTQPTNSIFMEPIPSHERRTLILTVEADPVTQRFVNLLTEAAILAGVIGRTLALIDENHSNRDFERIALLETVIEVRITSDIGDPSQWVGGTRFMMWQLLNGTKCDVVKNALVTDVLNGKPGDYLSRLYYGADPGPVLTGWPTLVVFRSFADGNSRVNTFNTTYVTTLDFSPDYQMVIDREIGSIEGQMAINREIRSVEGDFE